MEGLYSLVHPTGIQLIVSLFLGWTRDGRCVETQYESTPDHDPLGRNRLLTLSVMIIVIIS